MTTIFAIFAFILGAIFASFFGVIICRVPQGLSIVQPNSRCDECGHELKWYENIPIFSYIFLLGRCKECKTRIPPFSLIYEIIGGVSLCLTAIHFGISIDSIFAIVIVLLLLLIAGYDYATSTILDIMWILLAIVVGGYVAYRIFVCKDNYANYLIGLAVGAGFFGLIKLLAYVIFKKDGLGTGDVIIMAIAGLLVGPINLLIATLVASVLGILIEIPVMLISKKEDHSLPFCPYLVLGIFVSFLYGNSFVSFLEGVIENAIL